MPKFRLIVDAAEAKQFEHLCGSQETSQFSGLTVFNWEESTGNKDIAARRIELNLAKKTCLYYEARPIRSAYFDMDSTAIGQETIVELAACAGKSDEVYEITERAMAGELDFKEALDQRVACLKGLSTDIYPEVQKRLKINPGLETFASEAKKQDISCHLVSGGFIPFAKRIAEHLNFDSYHANHLDEVDGVLEGSVSGVIVDGLEKERFLRKTCNERNVAPKETLVVGDGANDLNMMNAGGIAIGYHPKKVLIEQINGAIFDDHRVLIDVLQP